MAADPAPAWWGGCAIKRPLLAPQSLRERVLYVDGKAFVRFDVHYFAAIENEDGLFVTPFSGNSDDAALPSSERLRISRYPHHMEVDVSAYVQPDEAVPHAVRRAQVLTAPKWGQLRLVYMDREAWLQVGDTDTFVKADARLRHVVAPAQSGLPELPLHPLGGTYLCQPPKNWGVWRSRLLTGSESPVVNINGEIFMRMPREPLPYLIKARVEPCGDGQLAAFLLDPPKNSPPFCAAETRFDTTREGGWEPEQPVWRADDDYWRGIARSFSDIRAVSRIFAERLAESLSDVRHFAANSYLSVIITSQDADIADALFPDADQRTRSVAMQTLERRVLQLFDAAETQRRLDGTDFVLAKRLDNAVPVHEQIQPSTSASDSTSNAREGFVANERIYLPPAFAELPRATRSLLLARHLLRRPPGSMQNYLAPTHAAEATSRFSKLLHCDPQALADALQSPRFRQRVHATPWNAAPAAAQKMFCDEPENVALALLDDPDTVIKLLVIAQQHSSNPKVREAAAQLDVPPCN
ncbi:MAG: hypothetical protein ACRYG5_04115 [Janthinobacterium lividum]